MATEHTTVGGMSRNLTVAPRLLRPHRRRRPALLNCELSAYLRGC
jgi:hypothetical protein